MARPETTCARVVLHGDDLLPEEITALMGCTPTRTRRKGQVLFRSAAGKERLAREGSWAFAAKDRSPGDLEVQIFEVLEALPSDLTLWRGVAERFKLAMFCGVFMDQTNVGCSLSPEAMRACADRGLILELDIYGPSTPESSTQSEQ